MFVPTDPICRETKFTLIAGIDVGEGREGSPYNILESLAIQVRRIGADGVIGRIGF